MKKKDVVRASKLIGVVSLLDQMKSIDEDATMMISPGTNGCGVPLQPVTLFLGGYFTSCVVNYIRERALKDLEKLGVET